MTTSRQVAILAGSMAIPIGLVNVAGVKKALTIKYTPMGADEALEVAAYRETPGYIHVPRQYGIELCNTRGIEYEDQTAQGRKVKFPKLPKPRDYQIETLKLISKAHESFYDFIFRARTGWGKTIGSLIDAASLGVTTLILVDQENLKDQWIESLVKHFGFREEDIGIIQGPKCTHEGKAVTIAMVQTLSQKTFPQDVYDYFGNIIVDETHIIGAATFWVVLLRFSAMYRMGVSATPKRRDALQKLLDFNLGKVRVYVEDEHDPSAVYVAQHGSVYSEYANRAPKIGRFINEVTEDGSRNLLIAESAAYLYDTGRHILVLSDRIEQLQHVHSLCHYLGIPEEEIGVYAGFKLRYGYGKDPTPIRRPQDLIKYDGTAGYFTEVPKTEKNPEGREYWKPGHHYTPVSLQLISKRPNKLELERVKTTCRIIFSTYGKFSKGVDESRLCGGIDASPRSTSEQVQGRILRKVDGKLKPIWITIGDTSSYRSLFALASRLGDYRKNNSVVSKWNLETGKIPCEISALKKDLLQEVERLKSLRIEKRSDGLNTLMTREQAMRKGSPVARIITSRRATAPVSPVSRTVYLRGVKPAK